MRRYFNLLRNLSNWWLYLAVKFGLSGVDPILFRIRKQVLVEVPRRLIQTFKEIFMDECYMVGLGLDVPHSSVVIDIGANAGFFTLFAASRFSDARILSFEPVPSNFRQLERNRSLNKNCRIACFEKAVAGHSGKVSLRSARLRPRRRRNRPASPARLHPPGAFARPSPDPACPPMCFQGPTCSLIENRRRDSPAV